MERAARLRQALARRGLEWTAPVEWPDAVASTNDALKSRARGGAPEWTVLCATAQTGGRGREGRPWVSPAGGLYLSVLLRPGFEAFGLLPLAAGVAVAEMAGELGVETELKWPNDALVGGRKVAGVLAESSSGATGVEWVVVGVGVNVAAVPLEGELETRATSLELEAGRRLSVEAAAAGVLARLRVWYDALERRPALVVDAWRARSAPWWGSVVEVRTREGVMQGTLRDVDDMGALLLDLDEGGRRRVLSGEVTRVRSLDDRPGRG
jgi:BirA family biotin operon repressor/biotin-[acetyl-CoA-carboxylase] ligase